MGEIDRHIKTRLAEPGDELVLTTFGRHDLRGFAAADDPSVAVGLPPGSEIRFTEPVACEPSAGAAPTGHRLARLRQVVIDNPCIHHDALEFGGTQLLLLTQLCEGQRATVVRLPTLSEAARSRSRDAHQMPLENIRLLAEPADDSGHPMFI
ncbi:hypothetical protein [Blastochloris viridis]|uniref:Uncharacterized protein n=1 Tax=Blastochloris viridis TaxID=1079 RepID=A0A0H5BF86_BLAVI|nr:hypothetical protein [Blastochloris viridis]ALK11006.1 hypothetical protein BVIR_3250 [Blastochloris viridis]BAR99006.1 hypothetical protein BV133_1413 [Blastochloris viridis]CUU43668.1 hypothetical protein BVIRIDIS_26940 [Blastochloris viridis]